MIEIKELGKSYGKQWVLKNINLNIQPGQVTALLGPNGAGKSTLIKILMGLVKPNHGRILWQGKEITDPIAWKRMIGFMPQKPSFPENLRLIEVIRMLKDLRGHHDENDHPWLNDSGLYEHLNKKTGELSGGNRQKLNALVAFMFDPDILFLDEPTAGMDPIVGSHFKDYVLKLRNEGKTIILSSHVLSEVEQLSDHIVYLNAGAVAMDIAMVDIIQQTGAANLERAIAATLMEMAS
jgi:Cu-processing system ATP-binding protein